MQSASGGRLDARGSLQGIALGRGGCAVAEERPSEVMAWVEPGPIREPALVATDLSPIGCDGRPTGITMKLLLVHQNFQGNFETWACPLR